MPVSLPSISLIYALLILVPGFLTYKTARRRGRRTEEVDRFDKAIYTVIGSGVSFSVIILLYTQISGFPIGIITENQYTVSELALGYLSMLVTAAVIGHLVGIIIDEWIHRKSDVRNETAWQLLAEGTKEPTRVRAVMNNGDEIWGEVLVTDSTPHGQDVLLKYPQKITREKGIDEVRKTTIGDYAFLSQSDISHIFFETEIDIQRTKENRSVGAWFYLKE
jgi:hypothetical protein